MYDSYPQHDVPQNNLLQRFFTQRWSAIVIEILMTIVISVAAGRAFDIFDPFDAPADSDSSIQIDASLPPEFAAAVDAIPLRTIERKAREYSENGQFAEAVAMIDLLSLAMPKDAEPVWYLEIAHLYDTLGETKKALANYRQYSEVFGKSEDLVAQSGIGAARGAG